MRIGMKIELIEKIMLIQHIAGCVGEIIAKGPAIFQHQRMDNGDRNKRLQPLKFANDQRAVRPRAGERNIQMVAIFFRGKTTFS